MIAHIYFVLRGQKSLDSFENLVLPFERSFMLYKVYGLMRPEYQGLVLEFQTVENILGLMRSKGQSLFIPWREILEIRLLPHRLRSPELLLQTRSLKVLRKLPGSLQGRYTCRLHRRDRNQAEYFVAQVELHLTELRIQELENPQPETPLIEEPLGRLLLNAAVTRIRDFLS
ncbi:hypothetical protein COW36_08445 [bacterium (Candidatus Blackallbacteria) CG17_big_fil_post_rev_8_21_14_2_50_48_46]|uniref:Uncharacterized protein n=1 Tax=bacterium (Candidatus Blackallbacteria) CG17_big_fil_post_rev_8_21_14_2_50_48_46 TaxID=2014261 RepID=A0A2M7G6E9_9BACT|nr:MAG: hypothetical protein COW64_24985 [bacterium (Candidatus Blackallbacteria) CG18_big_fil_WC_8_21_14_2_50_49_26]PIW17519.1 MAG: hypothetical protein COW36_08445 [bacterium (Candidatus Blackallbacteria) CG17_big_fil_post_rev_8_21_14_2_50_48_46]PIW48373.1 MAG: hypothetical protein COW20_09800 [bacterium (Candidatus Blackallbacteria) CG13_big_fil_rev_8_21_14_2_50_49_14]